MAQFLAMQEAFATEISLQRVTMERQQWEIDEQVQRMMQREQEADRKHQEADWKYQEAVMALEGATQLARANTEAVAQAVREAQAKATGMRDNINRET